MTLSAFFENELRQHLPKVVEEKFPARMIMAGIPQALQEDTINNYEGLLPFNLSLAPYRREFTYNIFTGKGIAEFYTHAADDIPQVSMGVDQITGRQKDIAIGYSYTLRDLQAAQAENTGLIDKNLKLARRGTDVKMEEVYYNGDAAHKLTGFLNFPGVTVENLPADGVGGSTTFASKDPDQKYRDLTSMSLIVSERSKNAFFAEDILLPLSVFNDVNSSLLSSASDNGDSVLTIFIKNQKNNIMGIKRIIPVPYLDGKGTIEGGKAVVYRKNADSIEAFCSEYFNVIPNQNGTNTVNMKYSVDIISTLAGTIVYDLLSMVIYDNV